MSCLILRNILFLIDWTLLKQRPRKTKKNKFIQMKLTIWSFLFKRKAMIFSSSVNRKSFLRILEFSEAAWKTTEDEQKRKTKKELPWVKNPLFGQTNSPPMIFEPFKISFKMKDNFLENEVQISPKNILLDRFQDTFLKIKEFWVLFWLKIWELNLIQDSIWRQTENFIKPIRNVFAVKGWSGREYS